MSTQARFQCVPNFSEGRNLKKVDQIVDAFRGKRGLKLLDYSTDSDHNRCVVSLIGEANALRQAVVESAGIAIELLDMNRHEGQHPRIGCVDVIPIIPLRGCTIEDANELAQSIAREIAEEYHQPIYLYEQSATAPYRTNLVDIRRGQFEGLTDKMQDPLWKPDFGPMMPHPTGGATAVGARMPLICFNVNLATSNLDIAREISRRVRHIGGGLRNVRAMGIINDECGIAQVTMNLTDYTKTAMYTALELVRLEAKRYGVSVVSTEVVGVLPMQAILDSAEYYMQIEDFSAQQILEYHLVE